VIWRQHDREAQQIGENGRQFARDRLKVTDTYCYYYRLLSEYAYRQDWDPKRVDGMELADHVRLIVTLELDDS